jgi:hypothetical protein
MFLVDCYVSIFQMAAIQGHDVIFFLFFSTLHLIVKTMGPRPPHTFVPIHMLSPTPLLLRMPTFGWLLCLMSKHQPPKAGTPTFSLFFDGSRFITPSKGTICDDREPAPEHLQRTHGMTWRQHLGALLPYPWRERAKPLEGRVAAALFDCCVCVFVCVFVFCVL